MPTEDQLDITLESELEFKPDHTPSTLPNMEQNNTTLPRDLQEQIKREIQELTNDPTISDPYAAGLETGYTAGATAYAPWKVKHDLLLLENERLRKVLEAIVALPVNQFAKDIAAKVLAGKGGEGNG
jgi:hypothetical protein